MEGESTRAVHADRPLADLPDVAPPIRPSSTFEDGQGRRYRRTSHATTERLEAVLGSLEGGHAVVYASGMAAASAAFRHLRPQRVSIPDDCYHGVRELVLGLARDGMIEVVPPASLGPGDVAWIETPSNPLCLITDLDRAVGEAHGRGALVVCDSTFATPVLQRPLDHGIDLVMHSATKAISGHSDAVAGVLVSSNPDQAASLRAERTISGGVVGSLDAWLALRGVRTLPLRVERASANAAAIADWFVSNGVVTWYPGLASHTGHDVAARQMRGFGSMLSVDFGTERVAGAFVGALRVFLPATSLGGVESLAEHRMRSDASVAPGLVRLSVGIEDVDDLLTDVAGALSAAYEAG